VRIISRSSAKGGKKLRRERRRERRRKSWPGTEKRAQAREKEGGAKESAQGSSERERQLAAFSRDDAASRLGFPRGGGKTRLVSLSLITIPCVVVDDEGRRRASGPVYRRRERERERESGKRACVSVRSCTHGRTRACSLSLSLSMRAPLFYIPLPSLSFSVSPHPSRFHHLFLFAPLLHQNARVRVCRGAALAHASPQRSMSTRCHASA